MTSPAEFAQMQEAWRMLRGAEFDRNRERIIEGIATTPTRNSHGYSVNPKGAVWELPIALLWWHEWSQPIGWVIGAEKSAAGVVFVATVATGGIPEINEVWE